jgi:hypothetical protein
MRFDRSFMNWEEGFGVCCWDAPSREELEAVFKKAGTPFERMITVEEHVAESLTS